PAGRGDDEPASGEATRKDDPLPDPVREQPPGQERRDGPDPDARERDGDRAQRQVVAILHRRPENRKPDEHGRETGLRGSAGGEDDPAIPRIRDAATYPEPGLIPSMQFDRHTLVLLVLRPDAPQHTDEEAAELQDRHLAFRADLRDRGYLIGGGPLVDQDDESLRGISIMKCDPETAPRVTSEHPASHARP